MNYLKIITPLFILLFQITAMARTEIGTFQVSATPVDTGVEYRGKYIEFENGKKLPTPPKEGIYKLRFTLTDLNKYKNPALYIGTTPYPIRMYIDGKEFFRWSHTLSAFKMHSVTPHFASLYSFTDKNEQVITAYFYNNGQTVAFPKFWIASREEVENYTAIQKTISNDGMKAVVTLSFIFGIILIFYYFISQKQYKIILFSGLFALCGGTSYSISIFDSPEISELFWHKVSRISLPLSAVFLYSSNLRLIGIKNKIFYKLEKLFYSLSVISAIVMITSPSILAVTESYKFFCLIITDPLLLIVLIIFIRTLFIKKEKNLIYIFIGFLAIITTGLIDSYYILLGYLPYVWASGYGHLIHILSIILTIGIYEQKIHLQVVQVKNELVKSNENVKRESKIREQFVKSVSHELRTPLNALVGIVQELSDKSIPYYNSLSLSVSRLRLSISNLFEYQNIGKLDKIELTEINPKKICKNIIDLYIETAKSKNITLEFTIIKSVPTTLIGDRVALESIINNVLSNAIKFTEKGEVKLEISYKDNSITLKIYDTGCGISETKINTIFNELQSTNIYTKEHNQIGIGLQIIQNHIQKTNGTINIKNREKGGIEVLISLPFKEVITLIKPKSSLKKVLIVEDNKINQLVVSKILKREGIKSDIAEDGLDAFEKMQNNHSQYFVVLMDIQMPIMNGLDSTKAIRKEGIETPIIALTANAEFDECISVGMNSFIQKPFDGKELIKTVHSYI